MSQKRSTYKFQTEARQVLDLMIHSVYSNKDIFLRELISNGSDALDKLRLRSLTDHDLLPLVKDLHIRVKTDRDKHILIVSDNGIGMDRDEIREFIGTIARSGTREYLDILKGSGDSPAAEELIGQFGVGFYSSFMVSEKVTLLTRKAGEDKAWKWSSSGDGTYTLEETSKEHNGTTVILELFPENEEQGIKDYTEEWVIRSIIRKYSDFIAYPIRYSTEKENEAGEKVSEDLTLNSMKALWMREEKDVSNEEYTEFYRHLTHDWLDPIHRFSFSMEGVTEFKGLLFIPSHASSPFTFTSSDEGISLYIKRVFIMSDCKALIPDYLRFLRGVIDSEDLPLNVSREILQDDPGLKMIAKNTTRRVLRELKKIRDEDLGKYLEFWKAFGAVLKEGILQDPDNRESILELSMFYSTGSEDDLLSLGDYVERMKEDQEGIFYISGQEMNNLKAAPAIEAFRESGYEVILMTDPVDEIMVNTVPSFKDKPFLSVTDGRVAPKGAGKDTVDDLPEELRTHLDEIREFFRKILPDEIEDVRLSKRLTTSLSCLVTDHENSISPKMQKILEAMGQSVPKQKRILEINPKHPLLPVLSAMLTAGDNKELLEQMSYLIYQQALIAEGVEIEDPGYFNSTLSSIMLAALDKIRSEK